MVRSVFVNQKLVETTTSLDVTVPGTKKLVLEPGTWRLELTAPTLFAPVALLQVDGTAPPPVLDLPFWPTVELEGSLVPPAGEAARDLRARFAPAGGNGVSREPRGELPCSVRDGIFRCPVPAITADLRLRASGFVSHYFWRVDIRQTAARRIGKLLLRPGGSLTGWLRTADGSKLPKEIKLRAEPVGVEIRAAKALAVEGTVEANGFMHMAVLPPGRHRVTARAEGWAEATTVVDILGRAEAELRAPLELSPPLEVQVQIDPAVPADGTWQLIFRRPDRERRSIFEERREHVPPSGLFRGKGFQPAAYLLTLEAGPDQQVLFREVDLATEPMPIQLEVERLDIAGRVTLLDRPIAAELYFGGRHAAAQVHVASDEEGLFEATLSRPGVWAVDVEAPELGIDSFVEVEVPLPRGGRRPDVKIELPDTRLAGKVVDENGRPLRALVNALPLDHPRGSAHAFSKEKDGRFELLGLDPRSVYQLTAEVRRSASAPKRIDLADDPNPPDVELVVPSSRLVRGRVRDAVGRPVPGVAIAVRFPGLASYRPQTSGGDGTFEAEVPSWVDQVQIGYAAPGLLLGVDRLPGAGPWEIRVHGSGGRLTIPRLEARSGHDRLILLNGLRLANLHQWLRDLGLDPKSEPLTIPGLEPGFYQLCDFPENEGERWMAGVADAGRCRSGLLAPQGELFLSEPLPGELP